MDTKFNTLDSLLLLWVWEFESKVMEGGRDGVLVLVGRYYSSVMTVEPLVTTPGKLYSPVSMILW